MKQSGAERGNTEKKPRKISKDLTGMRFGRLTVIRATDERVSGRIVWLCKCDCGNEVKATSSHLLGGHTTSCGCAREGVNRIDLAGKRFGRLVVLGPTEKRSGNSVVWHCLCDCGNEIDVSSARLRGGQTKSCGCLSSEVHKESFKTARKEREEYQVEGTDVKLLMHAPIKSNTSGKAGVSYDRSVRTWKASIVFKGHKYYLGSIVDKEKAIAMREEAEKRIHGEFLSWYYSEHPEKKVRGDEK